MAVTHTGNTILPGNYAMAWGTVVLDGTNPTPVALADYMSVIHMGFAQIVATAAVADDLNGIYTGFTGTTLEIEVYKNTSGSDPTYIDSTDSTAVVHWMAIGNAK